MNARPDDLLQRAEKVRALVDELDSIRSRCLQLGLALAPQIDAIKTQLSSEAHWCQTEATEGRQMADDITRFQKHLRDLEAKLVEARERRDALALEQRAAINSAKPGDLKAIAAQALVNKALEEQGRLLLSLEREVAEAKKRLGYAEAQRKEAARIAAAKAAASETKEKWFSVRTPDGRELRHLAHSYASLRSQLLPGYEIEAQIFGCDENGKGGFCAAIGQSPNALENMLAAFGPSLKRWLAGQA